VQLFFYFGVQDRLKALLEDRRISELLRLPDITVAPHDREDKTVRSLYDSQAWYDLVVRGCGRMPLRPSDFGTENGRRNIVLGVNLDGFQPFKTSHSLTPLTCMILNLPENLRHRDSFLLLAGLIPGPKQPANQNAYLDVFVDELCRLYEHGFEIRDPTEGGRVVTVRVKLLFVAGDYPAHQKNNCQQGASAHHGCIKCYIQVSLNKQRAWYYHEVA